MSRDKYNGTQTAKLYRDSVSTKSNV